MRHAVPRLAILLLAVAVPLVCGGCGEHRPLTVANLDELSLRMSTFHRQPTQDEFTILANSFARFEGDRQMRESASLMAAFIVFATERYGVSVDGVPDSQALTRFRTADRARFSGWLADGSTSPQKNDVWWVAFFCTGEERWLDRLLEVAVGDGTHATGDPAVIDLAGRSARWSYKSNAAQWEEVQRHAERHADHGNAFAAECVAYAKEHPELRRR